MSVEYLFRFDGAKDNDGFFKSTRERGTDHAYAGLTMEVGPGWIPDFLTVSLDEEKEQCTLVLIELEAKRADALVSSRKYLPESSGNILNAFRSYLDRVIAQCSSTADSRGLAIESLRAFLQKAQRVRVETACALRSDPTYLERLPLLDQPQTGALIYGHSFKRELSGTSRTPEMVFEGHLTLSRNETIGLNRAVLILDAIVRQQDHSDADLKAWISPKRNPLRKAIYSSRGDFPETWRFLATDKNSGAKITCETLFGELSDFWSSVTDKQYSQGLVQNLVREYYPIAYALKKGDRMRDVFERARPVVERQIRG